MEISLEFDKLALDVGVQLELLEIERKGDLQRLWSAASQTDLQFNLVS